MRLIIVTGMSGAGKSTALKILEDFGFFCVDNLPIRLIETFTELAVGDQDKDVALGIDIRSGRDLPLLQNIIQKWKENDFPFSIIFLDAEDEVLIKRFKETRRAHPLARHGRIEQGILLEREKLAFLQASADYVLDTGNMLTKELRRSLEQIFFDDQKESSLGVTVLSFGFKYGIPSDADLVFDVRFLPNPYYEPELREHTGLEKIVQDFVMQGTAGEEFLKKLADLMGFLLPLYEQEGKNQLVIAVGCTGGKHRSVTIACRLAACLKALGRYGVLLEHRDAKKDGGR